MFTLIPDVFTEQDRQEVIAAKIIEEELTDLPVFILKSDYGVISAALRLKDTHALSNDAFSENEGGFAFKVKLHPDVKHSIYGNSVYLKLADSHVFDTHSQVAFQIEWVE